jgi:hypothetical protein
MKKISTSKNLIQVSTKISILIIKNSLGTNLTWQDNALELNLGFKF